MKRKFTATVWREGDWHIAQCIEVDVISQGETEQEALRNLADAIQLYFEAPSATALTAPKLMTVEVEIGAA
jgi:predicted RNase H-like HicB family nuclease